MNLKEKNNTENEKLFTEILFIFLYFVFYTEKVQTLQIFMVHIALTQTGRGLQ